MECEKRGLIFLIITLVVSFSCSLVWCLPEIASLEKRLKIKSEKKGMKGENQSKDYYEQLISAVVIDRAVAQNIGMQIWRNEANQRVDQLVFWNKQEEFPSFGIGHFIWLPKGSSVAYRETFPQLCAYLKRHAVKLPDWLEKSLFGGAPWQSREECIKDTKKIIQLRDLLVATIDLQAQFMVERCKEQLLLIITAAPQSKQQLVAYCIERLLSSPCGMYALVDYCNFKGSGLDGRERKNGKGWGLLQVLVDCVDYMPKDITVSADCMVQLFMLSAIKLLTLRVQNTVQEGKDMNINFLSGWINRVQTYTDKNVCAAI